MMLCVVRRTMLLEKSGKASWEALQLMGAPSFIKPSSTLAVDAIGESLVAVYSIILNYLSSNFVRVYLR